MTNEEIQKAIEIVAESRRSHLSWIKWYLQNPQEIEKHSETCGDVIWHQDCIVNYDYVIEVLKSCL